MLQQLIQYQKIFPYQLKLPDFSKLARERYDAHKDEIAKIPEARRSSHILLACNDACDPMQKLEEGRKLRERLVSGERFETLVELYSGDPGSRKNQNPKLIQRNENIPFQLPFRLRAATSPHT